MSTLITLSVLLIAIYFWLDGARAREIATALSETICDQRNHQLLDGTVSRIRIGLRWTSNGLRLRRLFKFDYSTDGGNRRTGYVLLLGTELETYQLAEDITNTKETNVIPFKKHH